MNFIQRLKVFHPFEIIIILAFVAAVVLFVRSNIAEVSRQEKDRATARDAKRQEHVVSLFDAVKRYQPTNGGSYPSIAPDARYMIGKCNAQTNPTCDALFCAIPAPFVSSLAGGNTGPDSGIDLEELVRKRHLSAIPISPSDRIAWNTFATGYYLKKTKEGAIEVGACEAEGISRILKTEIIQDTAPPILKDASPEGIVSANNAQEITLGLLTDEEARCRYTEMPNELYEDMEKAFQTLYGFEHAVPINVEAGKSYAYYIKCQDAAGNTNPDDFVISFTVDTR